ncbi:type II toxin-antitoxin system PemK/MazF family toxin [Anaerovibrio lipolyticus]|uniref:type II toxin-antitoxin system PemK/MazF family toxin n=1 Tax=Anaerovibrio lipolyticus TaxID=82374 RepID=UPI0026F13A48|nr:type II toxin-antitoxin system PemK/MazF family toxin [Anaerovibrio lipolyticus]MBE6106790.1 type II toxin-antitoxin system PemK/MazF family toxin [Anaerovibrio lipolyticus]
MDYKKTENILELIHFQKDLVRQYWRYMNQLVKERYKNAALLTYWLRDYLQYLKAEVTFNPSFNITYKRGQIVYVNFGYRIGSELGGCHYAIVLDVKNSKSNSQLTVVPMKSKRDKTTPYSKIYHVDLGEEVKSLLIDKVVSILEPLEAKINDMISTHGLSGIQKNKELQNELASFKRQFQQAKKTCEFAENKLNNESIADVGQIGTVSKIRILHPVKKQDVLTGVCLSEESLKRIEDKVKFLYFGNNS